MLKLFTVFEQITIDLVHVLYRTFRQVKERMLRSLHVSSTRSDIDVQTHNKQSKSDYHLRRSVDHCSFAEREFGDVRDMY